MTDTPPDRLASHPKSPYYNAALLERGVGGRAHLVALEREREALAALIGELERESGAARRGPRYTRRMDERTRIRLTKYSTKAG